MIKVSKKEFLELHRNKRIKLTHSTIHLPAEKIAEQLKIWEDENNNFVNEINSISVMNSINIKDESGVFYKVFSETVCNRTFYILQVYYNTALDKYCSWNKKQIYCNVYLLLDTIN